MSESSLIKGTLTPEDAFARYEMPRLESQVKSILNQLLNGKALLENYLKNGITVNAQGKQYKFTSEEIKELIPSQVDEIHAIIQHMDEAIKDIGVEQPQANQPSTVGTAQVSTATAQQKGQEPIKTTTITPVAPKGKKA